MAIQDMYKHILVEMFKDIYAVKDRIIETWGYENFNVDIELTYDLIKDKFGNNAFGAFYRYENIIKISGIKLINFVGIKICNENLQKIGIDNCKKIFKYYIVYVLAHEVHHAYLYNVLQEEYLKIKKEDKELDYKESKLEKDADDHAIKYLAKYGTMARDVAELASELRRGKYNELKLEDDTNEEAKNRFISEKIEKIMKVIND